MLTLQVLAMRDRILTFQGDRRWLWNQSLLDADDRHGLESGPFIACMVPARTAYVMPRALSGVVMIPSG